MNPFRRRRRGSRMPKSWIVADDAPMLVAGKQFLEHTEDASNESDGLVLFIVDVRDPVGALWAAGRVGLDVEDVESFVAGVLRGPDGKGNPHPFVSFWMPRSPELLVLLQRTGCDVPAWWREMLENPPPKGELHTLIKRRGSAALMSVDFSKVSSPRGVPRKINVRESAKGKAS